MRRTRLGMITPSSNTVLEPMTARMLHGLPDVTAHFARVPVLRIALAPDAAAQFDPGPMLAAAALLADARVDVIAWNGTSAGWLGFDADRTICAAITEATGRPATSAALALNDALAALGARTLGLVTPYTTDVQDRIVATYTAHGTPVIAERHLEDPGNFSFAGHEEPLIRSMIDDVAAARPDAITAFCTNLRATPLAAEAEARTGIPVLDSIALVLWHAMLLAGADPARIEGWGRLFALQGSQRGGTPPPRPA